LLYAWLASCTRRDSPGVGLPTTPDRDLSRAPYCMYVRRYFPKPSHR